MIKESKHPIARALFVDKSNLAEREKEDLEFVDKLLSSSDKLFHSRYELLSVISRGSHADKNLNHVHIKNTHHPHRHSNVHKIHQKHHHHVHHPYHQHHHHHPVVNNIDDSIDLLNDEPGPVTASYLALIFWQLLVLSKLTR